MNYTRISADCHIDMPWVPDDLFTKNASAAMRDRMPYVTDGPDGPYWTCKNGTSFGLVGGVGPSGQKLVPGQNYRVDKMAEAGLYADGKRGIRRPTDPHLRWTPRCPAHRRRPRHADRARRSVAGRGAVVAGLGGLGGPGQEAGADAGGDEQDGGGTEPSPAPARAGRCGREGFDDHAGLSLTGAHGCAP